MTVKHKVKKSPVFGQFSAQLHLLIYSSVKIAHKNEYMTCYIYIYI